MTTLHEQRPGPTRLGLGAGIAAVLVVLLGVFLTRAALSPDKAGDSKPADVASSSPVAAGQDFETTAQRAANEGFPAMIPAQTPPGWTLGLATYVADTSWHFEATAPSGGPVAVDQKDTTPAELVEGVVGSATAAGEVDMRKWGTGIWQAFEFDGGYAVATQLPSTSVMVSGANRDEVIELTKQLLTAEADSTGGEGD